MYVKILARVSRVLRRDSPTKFPDFSPTTDSLCSSHTGLSGTPQGHFTWSSSAWSALLPDSHMAHSPALFRFHSKSTFSQKPFLRILSKTAFSHHYLLTRSIFYPLKCVSLSNKTCNFPRECNLYNPGTLSLIHHWNSRTQSHSGYSRNTAK